MINLDGFLDDTQKNGFYFKSKKCISKYFLIEIEVKTEQHNCRVVIYEIEKIPQIDGNTLDIKNGEEICTYEVDYLCEIDLWNKYYFTKFKNEQYQWYYDFDNKGKEDEVQALADVMNFAIKIGLDKGNIKLY